MVDSFIAEKYAQEDCSLCDGLGFVSLPDGESEYCPCVLSRLEEEEGERRFEDFHQEN